MAAKVLTPSEIMEDWPRYRVASWKGDKDKPIKVMEIRSQDDDSFYEFLKRVLEIKELDELVLLTVHRAQAGNENAVEEIISFGEWPKNGHPVDNVRGIISPRMTVKVEESKPNTESLDRLGELINQACAVDCQVPEQMLYFPYKVEVA